VKLTDFCSGGTAKSTILSIVRCGAFGFPESEPTVTSITELAGTNATPLLAPVESEIVPEMLPPPAGVAVGAALAPITRIAIGMKKKGRVLMTSCRRRCRASSRCRPIASGPRRFASSR
jgi:hypothetical protein